MDKKLSAFQESLSDALKAEEELSKLSDNAYIAYNVKLTEFEAGIPEIVSAMQDTRTKKLEMSEAVASIRKQIKDELSNEFIDDLPDGFTQKRSVDFVYDKKDMRLAALQHFHHLLRLDDEAVSKFFADNTIDVGNIPLHLAYSVSDFIDVSVRYKPLPNISNAKLIKLEFLEE